MRVLPQEQRLEGPVLPPHYAGLHPPGQHKPPSMPRDQIPHCHADVLRKTAHNLHQAEDTHKAAREGHGEHGGVGA